MDEVWTHWHTHPEVLIGLSAIQGGYLLGVGPVRQRYGLASGTDPRQVATFTLGILVIFVSLVSPLHAISDQYLFSAHMVQHVLLTLVAPPLLIMGTPDWLIRPFLRPNAAFRLARLVTHPIIAFALFNFVFAAWHIPALYGLSVTYHLVHVGEHLMFMGTAALTWWPITSRMPELPRLSYPLQIVYLFLLSIAQIVVFAPITFSRAPLYQWYVDAPRLLAISPVVDQQIGAIIMKMGGGALFLVLIIVAFFRWYSHDEGKEVPEIEEIKYSYL